MTEIELITLGSLRVRVDGSARPLTLKRALALLVYCACEPGPHSRDRLAELLWPEPDPGSGGPA